MNVLMELPGIFRDAAEQYRLLLSEERLPDEEPAAGEPAGPWKKAFKLCFASGEAPQREWENQLICGDNLDVLLHGLRDGSLKERLDLIYCDPPFFTRGERSARLPVHSRRFPDITELRVPAYNDSSRTGFREYLTDLALRLMLMRDTLKETGSILIHLDSRAVHSVKLLMDSVFGEDHFVNEIIWTYKSGGAAGRHLARKHDNILFYSKSDKYKFNIIREKSYNRGLKPYRFRGVEEFRDEIGWYTMVRLKDVWQVDMVGRSSGERLQYATQKPEALLNRIVAMTTEEGDLCADFYCGSGTLAASALRLGRRFLCVDRTKLAVANAMKRPLQAGNPFIVLQSRDENNEQMVAQTLAGSLRASREGGQIVLRPSAGRAAEASGRKPPLPERAALLMEGDPEALIDFWCPGTLDEEGVFHCSRVFRRQGAEVASAAEIQPSETHIWIGDILGGMTVLKIENAE